MDDETRERADRTLAALTAYTDGSRLTAANKVTVQFLIADLVEVLIRAEGGNMRRVRAILESSVCQAQVAVWDEVRD